MAPQSRKPSCAGLPLIGALLPRHFMSLYFACDELLGNAQK
jgi:hypothetical protein